MKKSNKQKVKEPKKVNAWEKLREQMAQKLAARQQRRP